MNLTLYDLIFSGIKDGYIEFSLGGVATRYRTWGACAEAVKYFTRHNGQNNIFFGPTVRYDSGRMGKGNCWKTQVCWVDIDGRNKPLALFPPSAVVGSGHGYHYYWLLNEPSEDLGRVEQANKTLAIHIKGDSAHNIDRIMRMPGTVNKKADNDPVPCKLLSIHPSHVYQLSTLIKISAIPNNIMNKILSGDRRGYRSASERDWAVIRALVDAGFTDDDIEYIFLNHACGDKVQDDAQGGKRYLHHTISKVREGKGKSKGASLFMEQDNCYYATHRGSSKLASTFVIRPRLLLEGDDEDWIWGDVLAHGTDEVWHNISFPRSAFSRLSVMSRYLTKTSWAWLGSDSDIRTLLAYLNQKMSKENIPKAKSTHVIGYHEVGTIPYFVTHKGVINVEGEFRTVATESPIVYVPTGREAPIIEVGKPMSQGDLERLAELVPQINTPEKVWPLIGWTMASPIKPKLQKLDYRFPILNVCGTRGSGKTATIQKILQPLLGLKPSSYDIGTTRFVALSLMGSTNAVPISFTEFRNTVNINFARYIRQAYDMGRDARGRSDQTTQEYILSAPLMVDGEDMMDDPAIQERTIVVRMDPRTIVEFESCWEAFQSLGELNLQQFALPYLTHVLNADVDMILDVAEQNIQEAFPQKLPDRIRRNLTVCWMGILSYSQFLGDQGVESFIPQPQVLSESLENVYSHTLKRAPMAADDYVEYIVNQAAQARAVFPWDLEGGVLWFQNSPAYDTYTIQRNRQRLETLSKKALVMQLHEMANDYTLPVQLRDVGGKNLLAFGVNLQSARDAGLDIPESFKSNRFIVDF